MEKSGLGILGTYRDIIKSVELPLCTEETERGES